MEFSHSIAGVLERAKARGFESKREKLKKVVFLLNFQLFAFLIAAIAATFLGGFIALRFKSNLKILVAFSAGLLVGVAFFDLLPEAFNLSEARLASFFLAFGFLLYFLLEKFILIHPCSEEHCETERHSKPSGISAILGLVLHRFLDGLVIALSFKANAELGLLVGFAIIIHSIPDGVNSVTVMLLKKRNAFWKFQTSDFDNHCAIHPVMRSNILQKKPLFCQVQKPRCWRPCPSPDV